MGSHRESCSISSGWMLPKARISFFRLVLFVLVSVLHVPSATGINLKGQKAVFQINKPNEYGTLSPTIKIPPLKEFTLCVDIRLKMKDNKGVVVFSYITDNQRNSKHELGITVTSRKLIFWLFHQKIEVEKILALHRWHSLCLTWHYQSKEALIYVNKTLVHSKTLGKKILGQNGSLVLGRQHRRKVDLLQIELERAFVGDLYLFRLWDFEKDQLSISELNCEDGTIITWDSQQWDFIGKILEYDTTLICCEQVFKPCFKQSEYELHGARISRRLLAHIPSNSTLASSAPNTTPESSTLNMITSLKKTARKTTPSTLTSQNTTGNYSIGMPEHQTNATEKTMFTATTPSRNTTEILLEFTDILNATELNVTAVGAIVSNLEEILQMESIDESLATSLVLTISNLLNASPDVVASFSTRLIKSVDAIGLKLDFTTESINITSSSLALAVSKFNSTAFGGSDFSISNITNLQVSLDERTSQGNFAAINLPSSLLNKLTPEEREKASRIQFTFYERSIFFQDPSMENTSVLNSYIIASSVANLSITNLTDPVKLTFRNLKPTKNTSDVQCVFWDFSKNNGTGGWNSAGCYIIVNADNETKCECGHLTHFGILLALSRDFDIDETNNLILTFITYIGCGLSSILLAVTLLTYLTFEKLRRDYPSKILINLCVALLLLNMTFLIDSWISTYNIDGLCIAVAVLLHYFLLVSFTWMSLEAFHMYLSLVKVFNTYVRRYILKFCIIGWGIPIIVISIVLNNPHNYGLGDYDKNSNSTIDTFCWIKEDIVFYIAVVGYFCVMFLLNISMFIVVMNQLYRIKNKKQHQNAQRSILQDMKSVTGLTFLLGITWGFAFFAWGPVNISFMYLFAIFNTLQGAFIFIFHCLTKETVQKQWRRYLCCGKLRLSENSDWSKTATNNIKKMQPLVQSMYSTSNNSLQSNSSLFLAKDYRSYPNVNGAKF